MRHVALSVRFHPSKRLHAPSGTPEGRAVARVIAELRDERLPVPGPADVTVNIPPVGSWLGRVIPSARLVVCYRLTAAGVELMAVKRLDA